MGGLVVAVACKNSAGPNNLPSCGAQGTPLSLSVAQYALTDVATDSGCVTFAANTSADTAEYLVLPWSVGGLEVSAPFVLQSASPLTASIAAARSPAMAVPRSRGSAAVAFDHFL